jgi:DNA repair photolyase
MEEMLMLKPNYTDGRFFVSPILGCLGACSYCYLRLHDYRRPRKNNISVEEIRKTAVESLGFRFGRKGTIISIGAWGDIFPKDYPELVEHSVGIITELLRWGNPVQIMSKYELPSQYVTQIAESVQYPGQLLYSTTITSIANWRKIEPHTSSPIERLATCLLFHRCGVPTNVLLKPFFPEITGTEIESISELLLQHKIDYCTIGILYWDEEIKRKILQNPFLADRIHISEAAHNHYLDCDGYQKINSNSVSLLRPYIELLREQGIPAFLKSSCVNANILGSDDPSGYYSTNSEFCIGCGNCNTNR